MPSERSRFKAASKPSKESGEEWTLQRRAVALVGRTYMKCQCLGHRGTYCCGRRLKSH